MIAVWLGLGTKTIRLGSKELESKTTQGEAPNLIGYV